MNSKATNNSRNVQIEGLRGASTLLIIIYHMFNRYQQIYLDKSISWMNHLGSFGVAIFFSISFYFLCDYNRTSLTFREGLMLLSKKMLRLIPTYIVAVTLIYVITNVCGLPGRTVSFGTFFLNVTLLNRIIGVGYVDGAHWYVQVLISITFITIAFRVLNIHRKPLTYLVWITTSFLINTVGTRLSIVGPEAYILGGFYAVYCSFVYSIKIIAENNNGGSKSLRRKWTLVALYCSLILLLWGKYIQLFELCVSMLILYLCLNHIISILEHELLQLVAASSYSIYLIHQNIGFLIQNKAASLIGEWNYLLPIFASVSTILIGIIFHKMVEKQLRSRIGYLLQ